MDERRKESLVGCLLFGGAAATVIGLVVTWLLYLGAAGALIRRNDPNLWAIRGIGPGLVAMGLLMVIVALIYGIREGRRTTSGRRDVRSDPRARIVARFAVDKTGEMILDEWLYDEREGVRFFVKIQHGDGRVKEYECRREVLNMCGEGLWGTATFDGRWLGGFAPTFSPPPGPV